MIAKKKIQSISVGILTLALTASYAVAQTWTSAPGTPPNSNAPAPLNVSASHQSKLAGLDLNTSTTNPDTYGLNVWGLARLYNSIQIPTGAGAGKVLTSDASGIGSWQPAPVGNTGGTGSGITYACAPNSASAPSQENSAASPCYGARNNTGTSRYRAIFCVADPYQAGLTSPTSALSTNVKWAGSTPASGFWVGLLNSTWVSCVGTVTVWDTQ